MAEEKSVEELEQETRNKLEIYETLLKENPTLNEIYRKSNKAAWGVLVGILLFIGFGMIGLFPVGLAVFIGMWVFFYKRNNRFDLAFEETASDELKKARKDYEDCKKRQEEAEKAKKEKRSAERQAKIQQVKEQTAQAIAQKADTRGAYEEDQKEREQEAVGEMLAKIYHRELVSSKPVHTTDLSNIFAQNAFLAQSFLDKVIILFGDIIKIDYDREKKMPYIIIGTGRHLPSDVIDKYICYFPSPGEIETLKRLQTGEMIVVCGIFSEIKYSVPPYGLIGSQIIASDDI